MTPANDNATGEVAKLRSALQFYASRESWRLVWNDAPKADRDRGALARAALGEKEADDA